MRTNGGVGRRGQQWFLGVILIAMLIDGILLAIVRANFLRDRGYDVNAQRATIAKPAPP